MFGDNLLLDSALEWHKIMRGRSQKNFFAAPPGAHVLARGEDGNEFYS